MPEENEAVELDDNMPPVDEIEESAPSEETETEETPAEETEAAPEEKKPAESPNFQKRINKVTRQKHEEKARADAAEAKLAELQAQAPQAPQTAEPKLEDFDYDADAHNAALVKYHVAQALAENQQKSAAERQEEARQQATKDFQAKVDAAGIEDYHEVIENLVASVPLPYDVVSAIQADDRGPELAYYLGNHLDVADKLAGLPPVQAALELGKISAGLSVSKKVKTTTAPEPVPTVGLGGGTAPKDPEEMSMDEIMALDI